MKVFIQKIINNPYLIFVLMFRDFIDLLIMLIKHFTEKGFNMEFNFFDFAINIIICTILFFILNGIKKQKHEIENNQNLINSKTTEIYEIFDITQLLINTEVKNLILSNVHIQFFDKNQEAEYLSKRINYEYYKIYCEFRSILIDRFKNKSIVEIESILNHYFSPEFNDEYNRNNKSISR